MTTGRDGGDPAGAGGLALHIPVLIHSVIDLIAPRDGGTYVDATFGAGGHAQAMLDAAACRVIALDRDRAAIAAGAGRVAAANGRLTLVEARFSELGSVLEGLGVAAIDGILFDFGVSSMQLDEAARGFSFRRAGPLDMRMGHEGPSAADVVASAPEAALARIIGVLGEERRARAVAHAIVAARAGARVETTTALADIVARVVHHRPGAIHPATRTFQALRMYVNDELGEIAAGLAAAERALAPGGRLAAISFHSLEDRLVKDFLAARGPVRQGSRHAPAVVGPEPSFTLVTRGPVVPEADEIARNPRARSAKLRVAARTAAPAHADDDGLGWVPRITEV